VDAAAGRHAAAVGATPGCAGARRACPQIRRAECHRLTSPSWPRRGEHSRARLAPSRYPATQSVGRASLHLRGQLLAHGRRHLNLCLQGFQFLNLCLRRSQNLKSLRRLRFGMERTGSLPKGFPGNQALWAQQALRQVRREFHRLPACIQPVRASQSRPRRSTYAICRRYQKLNGAWHNGSLRSLCHLLLPD
jgi:hypothetical protein